MISTLVFNFFLLLLFHILILHVFQTFPSLAGGQAGFEFWLSVKFLQEKSKTIFTIKSNLECSPMARETWVQSQVESYQKTLKMVLDTTLLNTQHYKVRFKGKVEQSWEWSSALPYTLV